MAAKPRPCKMGTMPMVVIVDGRCKVEPGKRIRWREAQHGSKWRHARVEKVYPDGYFFAEVV
jgi:hypothetical protein